MRIAAWAAALGEKSEHIGLFHSLDGRCHWLSVSGEAGPMLLAEAHLRAPRKILLITPSYDRALQWQARMRLAGIDEQCMRQLPSGLAALFEDATPETIAISERIGALRCLVEPGNEIIIATPQSALERTLPLEVLQQSFLQIKAGLTLAPGRILKTLQMLGYEPAEPVRIPGQFARRGGIIDIYVMGRQLPVRIEHFGDEVESVREFDPLTQRSVGPITVVELAPSRETVYSGGETSYQEMLQRTADQEAMGLSAEAASHLIEVVEADSKALDSRTYFSRLDLYRPILHPDSGCALDLVGPDGLLVLDEPLELEAIAARSEEELGHSLEARRVRGEILHSTAHDYMLPPEHMGTPARSLSISAMNGFPSWDTADNQIEVGAQSLEPYRGQSIALAKTMKTWLDQQFCVVVGTDQPTRSQAVLKQIELFPTESGDVVAWAPGVHMASGNIAGGFVMPQLKFALITDLELFGVGRLRLPQKRFHEGVPIATVLDLSPGDYVVHIQYGIGVFRGLVKQQVAGVEKECLLIDYAAPDRLFVPADQLDRVQKYLNPGDTHPKLNRLTGGDWQRTVGKAREEARAFARDLIKLYAQRQTVQRAPYGPDAPWQAEMEATFPWVETPSQLTAIKDVKRDLVQGFPMDRVICGDVGFGKTEVAIRAAFKVAVAGRQVAVLCPTTILSEQHFRNFCERLGAFPVRLAFLNRFVSAGERKQIARDLESGELDIVIGTHALLSEELKFKNLGLVVIDEEQKFGVKQKEMLKKLRTSVDVLSMSATPIPRTLSMALMDIRQMSLINDPPPGRLPIRTFVRPHSDEVIREAILRELARGGQVFFVYNRVQGIVHVADKIRRLVPTAKIAIGHGQMGEKEIEPVMHAFFAGEIDVLVSTTIVESGLDIPNVNTLIVENSDKFGLSQLYQLRGRVGRSDRQAYAYLLYQESKDLSEGALARLQALQEFSTLGSGYSLAFRDLQIRGAGELLGAKQHGAMANIGYELYTQLIQEEVALLKTIADGGVSPEIEGAEPAIPLPAYSLPVVALIPETYVRDQGQRLYGYMRIMNAASPTELGEAREELVDRYGKPPKEVERAFEVMHLRMLGRDLGIEKVDGTGGRLAVSFRQSVQHPPRVWSLVGQKAREAYLSRDQLIWPFTGEVLPAVSRMLGTLGESVREVEESRRLVAECSGSG